MYQAVFSGKISGNGVFTKKCQSFFESRYGFKKCLMTTSCSDALEMAAILCDVQPGDEVIVFGPDAAPGADTADTVAEKTGTINYEIICGISRRVPRVYLQNGVPVRIWNDLEEN